MSLKIKKKLKNYEFRIKSKSKSKIKNQKIKIIFLIYWIYENQFINPNYFLLGVDFFFF
jgi:hypothetical protein